MGDEAREWAAAFGGVPVITFMEIQEQKSKEAKEIKRTRTSGEIVEETKKLVTATEIGKATVITTDTQICDDAARQVQEDIRETNTQQISEEK